MVVEIRNVFGRKENNKKSGLNHVSNKIRGMDENPTKRNFFLL
jgi:hypothetical protein